MGDPLAGVPWSSTPEELPGTTEPSARECRLCANAMPEPGGRPLAEVYPAWDGPAEFEAAIRKAMDPDPERRFASAEALRLALEAIRTCNPDPASSLRS